MESYPSIGATQHCQPSLGATRPRLCRGEVAVVEEDVRYPARNGRRAIVSVGDAGMPAAHLQADAAKGEPTRHHARLRVVEPDQVTIHIVIGGGHNNGFASHPNFPTRLDHDQVLIDASEAAGVEAMGDRLGIVQHHGGADGVELARDERAFVGIGRAFCLETDTQTLEATVPEAELLLEALIVSELEAVAGRARDAPETEAMEAGSLQGGRAGVVVEPAICKEQDATELSLSGEHHARAGIPGAVRKDTAAHQIDTCREVDGLIRRRPARTGGSVKGSENGGIGAAAVAFRAIIAHVDCHHIS